MGKVILVLCDALRNDVAAAQMGYLEMMIEQRCGTRYVVESGLPSLSRPLYETIHTGVPASEHGITSNLTVRRSMLPSVFSVAREHGKTTAAAAYSWYSELYVKAPFDPVLDRELDDDSQIIQHGRFYFEDSFPDAELFAQTGLLITRHLPDYVLIHPMSADTIGHKHGSDSAEYRNAVLRQDQLLAYAAPQWLAAGYTVLVTGDHGMNADRQHNGTLPDVRHVPLYVLPVEGAGIGNTGQLVSQLVIAPTICHLLGLPPAPTMTSAPLAASSNT